MKTTIVDGIGTAIREAQQMTTVDPAPRASDLARERAQGLVKGISASALDELRQLRDEINSLMSAMRDREVEVLDTLHAHAAYAESVITAKLIIAEHVTKLRSEFEGKAPKTVTVNGGENV